MRDARVGDSLLPIPKDLPYEVAALTEPLSVAMHGVNRAQAKPGDKVVVFGCGPIGLGMVLWLKDRGVDDVIALDLSPERLERARDARCAGSDQSCQGKRSRAAARVAWYRARVQPRGGGHGCLHRCRRGTQHRVRCREHGEAACAPGGDGGLHETGTPRSRRHADHRDDHNDRRRLPDRDAGCHRGAVRACARKCAASSATVSHSTRCSMRSVSPARRAPRR